MNKEINSIITEIQNVNNGSPWFGRNVFELLDEVDESKAFQNPNADSHSLAEIIYHMNTWAGFTLKRIEKDKEQDLVAFEKLDWRKIDPKTHSWKKGLAEFKSINKQIIELLKKKEDSFLEEKVDYRDYNFRFLINGLIQHNIYHLGQIAYINKMLG